MATIHRVAGATIVHDGCVHRASVLSPNETRRLEAARAAVRDNLPPIRWDGNDEREDMLNAIVWSYECATEEDARASLTELEEMAAKVTGGRRAQAA